MMEFPYEGPTWRATAPISVDQGWMHVEGAPLTNDLLGVVVRLHNSDLPPHHPAQFDPVMFGRVYAWTADPDTIYFWRGIRIDVKGGCNGQAPFTRGEVPPFDN